MDGLASKIVRYYHPVNMSTKDVLIAVGRGPRQNFEADFELQFVRPADFSPKHVPRDVLNAADIKLDPGRPEVTFLFGLHDIDTPNEQNPETHKNFIRCPRNPMAFVLARTAWRWCKLARMRRAANYTALK